MQVKIIKNQAEWSLEHPFAQTWSWGEVLGREKQIVERLAILESEQIVARAQIIYKPLFLGWRYAFCPQGPIIEEEIKEKEVYRILADYLLQQRCVFLRVEPAKRPAAVGMLKTKDINPRATVVLDLSEGEEKLLAGMKKNTRYSIRFAEKQGLDVREENNLEVFWKLLKQTAARDKFTTHPKEHYANILAHPQIWQLTAWQGERPIASAIFIGAGGTLTYLFAASDYSRHKLLAPYLLQWESIKLAKQKGYRYYDFFGIAPGEIKDGEYVYSRKHQYAGITKFKLGFGGTVKSVPGTFDLALCRRRYGIYKFLRFLRMIFRFI